MRSLVKPPLVSKLTAKFFKYNWKVVFTKIYSFRLKKLLAYEKFKVFLLMNKELAPKTLKFLMLKFENYNIQSFFVSLFLHFSSIWVVFPKKIYFFAIQNLLDYARWFYRWDISLNRTKFFFFKTTKLWWPTIKFLFLKDFAYTFDKQIYQGDFTWLKNVYNIFFYNIFFYVLMLGFYETKLALNVLNRTKIYYYADCFMESIFCGKYYEFFHMANRYLTLQTGLLKNKKFYVNRNYLFTTTTQLLWAWKVFVFKYFFWNNHFWFVQKIKNRFKWSSAKKTKSLEGIYSWNWSTQILPFFINKIFYIHNGVKFFRVWILPGMVGYKLGQFSFTWKIHARNVNLRSYFKNLF